MDTEKIGPEKIKLKQLTVCILIVLAFEILAKIFLSINIIDPLLLTGLIRLLEISSLIAYLFFVYKSLNIVGLNFNKFLIGCKKGALWSIAFGIIVAVVFFIMFLCKLNPFYLVRTTLPKQCNDIILFFLLGGFIAPIAEELFFRGILYNYFRKWGILLAIILTTLIFAFSHMINSGFPFTQLIGGVLFAICYEIEKSLFAPITIHILANSSIFLISLIVV